MGLRVDHHPPWTPLRIDPAWGAVHWVFGTTVLCYAGSSCLWYSAASPGEPPEALTGRITFPPTGDTWALGREGLGILMHQVRTSNHAISRSLYRHTIHFHSVNPGRSETTSAAVTSPPTVRARVPPRPQVSIGPVHHHLV